MPKTRRVDRSNSPFTPIHLACMKKPETDLVPKNPQVDELESAECRDETGLLALYMRQALGTPLLTRAEERSLGRRILRGDSAARERMIKANLRLVVKIAQGFRHRGLSLSDLISEGNIGLMKAVDRYDPKVGAKFSCYATFWIRQKIKVGLAQKSKTICLPVQMSARAAKMRRVMIELTEELGRDPTTEEVATALNMPTKKVAMLQSVSAQPASLNATYGADGEGALLGDIVADEHARCPLGELEKNGVNQVLFEILESMDPRYAMVLKRRFGLYGHIEATLEDLGQEYQITRERIRQIEGMGLRELRQKFKAKLRQRTRGDIELERGIANRTIDARYLLALFGQRAREKTPTAA